MIGQLYEHPLAELLHEISAAGLSGALRLEFERLKTVVYLADGEVIYAASNLRRHRLAECVQRWGVLSAEELSSLPASQSDLEFVAALQAEKALSLESIEALQSRQVAEILRPALLWTKGTWEFNARVRMAQEVRVQLDLKSLLMEGARRLPAEFADSRFSNANEKLLPVANAPVNLELLPTEAFVLSRIDAPLTLSELIAISTLPETETKQIVYTLTLGGLLERERWPRAFTEETIERARAVKAAQQTAPQPAPSQPQVQEASADIPAVAAKEDVKEELELDDLFARLAQAENYYQVLGVARTAPVSNIKSSYHKLAKRFHPDRFYQDVDAALYARIGEAFARIAQAYETLKDKQSRATYDLKLSQQSAQAGGSAAVAQTSAQSASGSGPASSSADDPAQTAASLLRKAEDSFGRGVLALQQGKSAAAIAAFAEAARLVPQEARYRAHHGRALATNEGTRRQAEAELKAAISLDAKNAAYHVMLAEFYFELGLPRRAQHELDRALAIDSHNTAARRLLDNLKATTKG
jgi:hypothetical protein